MPPTTYTEEVVCVPRAGTLYDVMELILDRGMVIDVFVRVSLVGIEILKIDARVVVASVDTYLRFAEACNRVDLERDRTSRTVPELFGGGGGGAGAVAQGLGKRKVKKAVGAVEDKVKRAVGEGGEDDEPEPDEEPRPRRRTGSAAPARTRRRSEED
ncbi:gas vesicle protein GvpJ [Streptomyces sp. RTd22]|uniref:gas vesicle protein GvpJ n=1 Tax=Streptomyces sp. RTd22 TaxID=1841249 RepID=UPI0007C4D559|nr:gas vesicle protein GvpJ [Streptomyces sp. RTd22]